MKSKLWGSNQLSSASQSVSVMYFFLIPGHHLFHTEMLVHDDVFDMKVAKEL